MGTWGIRPFDNDAAADFAYTLDTAVPEARAELVRGVLVRTADAVEYLDEADEAVAAAALIAAQCPGGEPVDSAFGPDSVLPEFPVEFRALADEALARVVGDEDGVASAWFDPEDGRQWRAMLAGLRGVLAPLPPTIPLFEL